VCVGCVVCVCVCVCVCGECVCSLRYVAGQLCSRTRHRVLALVVFDDVDILAFHSCVLVDLWQSLSE